MTHQLNIYSHRIQTTKLPSNGIEMNVKMDRLLHTNRNRIGHFDANGDHDRSFNYNKQLLHIKLHTVAVSIFCVSAIGTPVWLRERPW